MKKDDALLLAKTRFQRIGGSFQPVVATKEDLENILKLDPAYWTLNSIDIDKLDCDKEFLLFLDSDRNGKVRVDETKAAIAWLLPLFRDFSGVISGSPELLFSSLDETNPDAAAILQSAKRAMHNAGTPDAASITLSHIRDDKKLLSLGLSNGDGVVPPSQIPEEHLSAFAGQIMAVSGKKTDISGLDGIDKDILAAFEKDAKAVLAWKKELVDSRDKLLPYGEDTGSIYKMFLEVQEKVDAFFCYCQGIRLLPEGACTSPTLNPLDGGNLDAFLQNAPLQKPRGEMELDLAGVLNPLWEKPVRAFFGKVLKEEDKVPYPCWLSLKAAFAPYGDYMKRKPSDKFDAFTEEEFKDLDKNLADGKIASLSELIAQDLSIDTDIQCFARVRKLILYQKNLVEFLNNFVCLKELFNPEAFSMLQPGKLIMDGRHFTLVNQVTNIAAHKKLAARCYICVMYLEASTGAGDTLKKQQLAVGVTSGDMNNLFVGKCGIFIAKDSVVWDARVVDYIQQPVSFSEALKMPFIKFGEFIGKQVDKFFTSRSKEVEKELDSTIKAATMVPPKGAKLPPGKVQTPAVSGSMMLMGGGVGLAALGSSFAFMAHALKNVSLWHVLAVFLCIILIFSGPLVILSLMKLYRRNVASFLEAGGTAINRRMRLTRKMGAIFTRTPHLPLENVMESMDIVSGTFLQLTGKKKMGFWMKALITIVVLALGLLAGMILWQILDPSAGKFFPLIYKR